MYKRQELLFGEEKLIRRFVEDDKFDELIDAAIRKHSDFKLEGIHDARTLFHAKLIRDADKLDNCRVKLEASVEAMLGVSEKDAGEGLISPAVWESCLRRESVLSADRHVPVDYWVSYLAQYYDINFPETCEIIEEEDYITRIAGRLTYQEQDTRTKPVSYTHLGAGKAGIHTIQFENLKQAAKALEKLGVK